MVVHPRVRHEAAKGEEDRRRSPRRGAQGMLSKLESMDISSPKFIDELTKFRDAVLEHAEHDENEEFTKLERKLKADDRTRMAKAVQAAEAIAPTHPHPDVESAKLNFAAR